MRYAAYQIHPSRLAALPNRLYEITDVEKFERPQVAHINNRLLGQLGIEHKDRLSAAFISYLSAKHCSSYHQPIATVYAGHQFGIYTSKLGDGRVHILGDISTNNGEYWEVQFKGAGPTPFARGNNGHLSMAEAITEYLGCEAMAGLGIATTRGLALITHSLAENTTQELKSVLVRTAHSHLRFGHFEYLHNQGDTALLKALADFVIEHHYPELMTQALNKRYLLFLYAVTQRTAKLVAQWQSTGFVHSVMNTDNMSVLGITLDYGVFRFMEQYDRHFSPNQNDDQDRYAFSQQVEVSRWNCLALAEALIELLPGKRIPATLLRQFRITYTDTYHALMGEKLGLSDTHPEDGALVSNLLNLLQRYRIDYTRFFRRLCHNANTAKQFLSETIADPSWVFEFNHWFDLYRQRQSLERLNFMERQKMMLTHNPKYILRQHQLDHAIRSAEQDKNFTPLEKLLSVLQSPYLEHPAQENLA